MNWLCRWLKHFRSDVYQTVKGASDLCDMMSLCAVIALSLFLLSLAKAHPSLRGGDLRCTGEGDLPAGPVCYGNTLLSATFKIHVVSHDGEVGIVHMKAEGSQEAQCDGAQFQNKENIITIENDHGCGVSSYEYSVQYCPDQNNLMIEIGKPSNVRMVLESQACPTAAEEKAQAPPCCR